MVERPTNEPHRASRPSFDVIDLLGLERLEVCMKVTGIEAAGSKSQRLFLSVPSAQNSSTVLTHGGQQGSRACFRKG